MSGTAQVIRGNALALPIPDGTVDLICTSPPYFALRSYTDGGAHYAGQVGSEATPAEFVDTLIAATAEMVRVLKPSGSIWVNLGDKYAAHQTGHRPGEALNTANGRATSYALGAGAWKHDTIRPKSLIGIPWRYALRCIDDLGLILRAEVIWSKPNGLPESVTDRVRRSHEQWFHFTVQPRYYSAVDEIREAHVRPKTAEQLARDISTPRSAARRSGTGGMARGDDSVTNHVHTGSNPLGKLPGSVWTIPTQPLTVPPHLGVDHFAAFPTEWPRRIITGWSPREVCTACGEGRRPVASKDYRVLDRLPDRRGERMWAEGIGTPGSGQWDMASRQHGRAEAATTITGYGCACTPRTSHRGQQGDWREGRQVMPEHGSDDYHSPGNAVPRRPGGFGTKVAPSAGEWEYHFDGWVPPPTTPGVVLDPFGGTGTTALVAKALGRHGITVDLSADYCRLARWRTTDPDQLAKAQGIRRSDAARAADGLDMDYLFDIDGGAA